MSIAVTMRGLLEPIIIDQDFAGALNAMNMSAAKGIDFIACMTPDGDAVALHIDNILTMREVDDD